MNKLEFRELINYLKNRPSECESLVQVLGLKDSHSNTLQKQESAAPGEVRGEWLSARQVGYRMGRSGKWIRDHLEYIPEHAKRKVPRGHLFEWMFLWPNIENILQPINETSRRTRLI